MSRITVLLILVIGILLCSGCQTVTISESHLKKASHASYNQTQWFFLWGLIPRSREVYLDRVCRGRVVAQMQTYDSVVNKLLRYFTLGIIYPKTAKVWCK